MYIYNSFNKNQVVIKIRNKVYNFILIIDDRQKLI